MWGRFTSALRTAAEALAPTRTPLEDFKHSWQSVTDFVMLANPEDRELNVENTHIPAHLTLMVEILQKEEEEYENAGPCMEHLLRHNILKTAVTLGQSDHPAGMMRAILRFCTQLLANIVQPLMPHVGVHAPIQRLVFACWQRNAGKPSPEDLEFVNFLCAVCGKLVDDPSLAMFFTTGKASGPPVAKERVLTQFLLPSALLSLCRHPDTTIAQRAREGLLVCLGLQPALVAQAIVEDTFVCENMAGSLAEFFLALPPRIEEATPAFAQTLAAWMSERQARLGLEHARSGRSPDVQALLEFLAWFQLCDEAATRANALVQSSLATCIKEKFLEASLRPRLAQPLEATVVLCSNLLTACLTQALAPPLVFGLVRLCVDPEPAIAPLLLARCDDVSDEISLVTMRLLLALLSTRTEQACSALALAHFTSPAAELPSGSGLTLAEKLSTLLPAGLHSAESAALDLYLDTAISQAQQWVRGARRWTGAASSQLQCPPEPPLRTDTPWTPALLPRTPATTTTTTTATTTTAHTGETPSPSASTLSRDMLALLLRRLRRVGEQPHALNLVLTSLLTELFLIPSNPLHSFLAGPDGFVPVLEQVVGEFQGKSARVADCASQLIATRAHLNQPLAGASMSMTSSSALPRFLRAVVLTEEFLKELAAVAAVWGNPSLVVDE